MTIWITDKLRNLPIEFVDGDRSSKYPKRSEFVPEGIPFLNAESINEGYLNLSKANFITEEKFSSIKKGRLHGGDLILTTRGNGVGKAAYFSGKPSTGLINAQLLIIRPEQKHIFPRFLYYSFINPYFQGTLKNFVSGSAQPQLPIQSLREVELSYPPLPIQCKIAAILSAYDDLIENNTRRIEILEEMARSLYREWFVNFRFPGHEQVKMVNSELGLIPESWEVKRLGNIVLEIIDYRGKTPKKLGGDWSESGILAISAKNIKQGKLINLDKSNFVDEALYKKWMKSELKQGDILMTSEAPLGELYYLVKHQKFCLSQRVYSIRANPDIIKPSILFSALYSPLIQEQIYARQSGTTVLGIRQTELRKVPVIVPPINLQTSAAQISDDLFKSIETLQRKKANLRQTRDLLLPKLISGEIDVENLDINTGEIAA
jgi:type I restriction enzyme S subunit